MSKQTFLAEYQESIIVAVAKAGKAGISQGQIDLWILSARRANGAWF